MRSRPKLGRHSGLRQPLAALLTTTTLFGQPLLVRAAYASNRPGTPTPAPDPQPGPAPGPVDKPPQTIPPGGGNPAVEHCPAPTNDPYTDERLGHLPEAPTARTGTIPGAFSVGANGNAVYRIPIAVPPGRAGMEPELALTYSGGLSSGILGTGFQLDGLSAIARCGSNLAHDGVTRDVAFDSRDHFCLDGARLVPVGQPSLQNGQLVTEYRTFPDTFTKVLGYASSRREDIDKGPYYFEAWLKSGRIIEYGKASSGRIDVANGITKTWLITFARDRYGNGIEYLHHNERSAVDQHTISAVPKEIRYTTHPTLGGNATRWVTFEYQDNLGASNGSLFSEGVSVSAEKFLVAIHTFAMGDEVRSYHMSYGSSASGRWHLDDVSECYGATQDTCKPRTFFTWTSKPHGGFTEYPTGIEVPWPAEEKSFAWTLADVTGDGLPDLVSVRGGGTSWYVAKGAGFHFESPVLWPIKGPIQLTKSEDPITIVPMDVNHDGLVDLIVKGKGIPSSQLVWLRSEPVLFDNTKIGAGQFTEMSTGVDLPVAGPHPDFNAEMHFAFKLGDLNADGKEDIITCHDPATDKLHYDPDAGQVSTMLSKWSVQLWKAPSGAFDAPIPVPGLDGLGCWTMNRYVQIVDFNGNGIKEIVAYDHYDAGWERHELSGPFLDFISSPMPGLGPYPFQPYDFAPSIGWEFAYRPLTKGEEVWFEPQWEWANGWPRLLFSDANGDQVLDLVSLRYDSGSPGITLGRGNGALGPTFWDVLPSVPDQVQPPQSPPEAYAMFWAADQARVIDYDADGRDDLLVPMSGLCPGGDALDLCWMVLRSGLPGAKLELVNTGIPMTNSTDWESTMKIYRRGAYGIQTVDMNGDGLVDIVRPDGYDGFKIYLNEGSYDRVATITDGLNPKHYESADPQPAGFVPTVAIHYRSLIDQARSMGVKPASMQLTELPYHPRFDPTNDCAYPRACVVSAMPVVHRYEVNNGQDDVRSFAVEYRDGRVNLLGLGFLGFGSRVDLDLDTMHGSITTLDNRTWDNTFRTYPFAGQATKIVSFARALADEPDPTRIDLAYEDVVRELYPTNQDATYFTFEKTRTRRALQGWLSGWDIASFVTSMSSAAGALSASTATRGMDAFGHVVTSEGQTKGVDDFRKVTRKVVFNPSTWLLEKVDETACSTVAGLQTCRSSTSTYGPKGRLATTQEATPQEVNEFLHTDYSYDSTFGNLKLVSSIDGFSDERWKCTGWDPQGIFPYSFGNSEGHRAFAAFDPGSGVQTAVLDLNGLRTQWQLDGFGRMAMEVRPDGTKSLVTTKRLKNGGPNADQWQTRVDEVADGGVERYTILDSMGRAVRSVTKGAQEACDDLGCVQNASFVELTRRDFLGRVESSSQPFIYGRPEEGAGSPVRWTKVAYDAIGRPIRVEEPGDRITTTTYNVNGGNRVDVEGPGSHKAIWFDGMNRTTATADLLANGTVDLVTLSYGAFGGLAKVTNHTDGTVYETIRDARGRVVLEKDPNRGERSTEWNGYGEPRSTSDALGRTALYVHDSVGRLTTRTDSDGTTTTWEYDTSAHGIGRLGRTARVTAAATTVTGIGYDSLSRPEAQSLTLTTVNGLETFTSSVAYDGFSRVHKLWYPKSALTPSFAIVNEYDGAGGLVAIKDPVSTKDYWRAGGLDGAGRLRVEQFKNGVTTERTFDPDHGRIRRIDTNQGMVSLQALSFAYDERLNLIERADELQPVSASAHQTERFIYDGREQLTCSYFAPSDEPPQVCAGLTCACDQRVVYAPNGNIKGKSDVGRYTYGDPLHPHAVTEAGDSAYAYDAVGNQIERPGASIVYDALNQPSQYILTGGAATIEFAYDADQHRVRKISASEELVNVSELYERRTPIGGKPDHRFTVSAGGRPVAIVTQATGIVSEHYLHTDHLGSIDLISGAQGNEEERRSYDAFGQRRDPSWGQPPAFFPALVTSLGFTGHKEVDELGVTDARRRAYDAKLGRFLQVDPVQTSEHDARRWNGYSYVLNNPLNYTDPSGMNGTRTSDGEIVFPDDHITGNPYPVCGSVCPSALEMSMDWGKSHGSAEAPQPSDEAAEVVAPMMPVPHHDYQDGTRSDIADPKERAVAFAEMDRRFQVYVLAMSFIAPEIVSGLAVMGYTMGAANPDLPDDTRVHYATMAVVEALILASMGVKLPEGALLAKASRPLLPPLTHTYPGGPTLRPIEESAMSASAFVEKARSAPGRGKSYLLMQDPETGELFHVTGGSHEAIQTHSKVPVVGAGEIENGVANTQTGHWNRDLLWAEDFAKNEPRLRVMEEYWTKQGATFKVYNMETGELMFLPAPTM